MDRPFARTSLYAVLVLLLLVVVGSDWPTGLLTAFWAEHAMLTNVVSSVIFVALGATFIQRWQSRQDDKRFELIEATAFGAITRPPLAIRHALWFLIYGEASNYDEDFVIEESESALILDVMCRHGFDVVREADVVNGKCSPPSDVQRLYVLMQDPEWIETSYLILRRTAQSSRLLVSRWAHLLVAAKRSARALEELTAVIDDLRAVRSALGPDRSKTLSTDAGRVHLLQMWRKCFVNSAVVYEDLGRLARYPVLTRWSYILTQPDDQRRLRELGIEMNNRKQARSLAYDDSSLPSIILPSPDEHS